MLKSVLYAIIFIAGMILLGGVLVGYEIVPAIVGAVIWLMGPIGAIIIILHRAATRKK